jgi:hypothetical protein
LWLEGNIEHWEGIVVRDAVVVRELLVHISPFPCETFAKSGVRFDLPV